MFYVIASILESLEHIELLALERRLVCSREPKGSQSAAQLLVLFVLLRTKWLSTVSTLRAARWLAITAESRTLHGHVGLIARRRLNVAAPICCCSHSAAAFQNVPLCVSVNISHRHHPYVVQEQRSAIVQKTQYSHCAIV